MLSRILGALHQATEASKDAMDSRQRAMVPYLAIVTNNVDPQGLRRVKVTTPQAPGIETPWLRRVLTAPHQDPPLPDIGQTVLVLSIDGDPMNGWFMTANNLANPPQGKGNPVADFWDIVKGDRHLTTQGNLTEKVGQNRDLLTNESVTDRAEDNHLIEVGKVLTVRNDAGASLVFTESGHVVLCDAFDHCITLSGGIGNGITWDLNGDSLDFVNAGDVTIDGKSVIVVGSKDTDNDTNNDRGY
jgi:hypothetical protein